MKIDLILAFVCSAVSAMSLAFLFVRGMLGTAHGLSPRLVKACDAVLRPLRFMDWNHLAVRSAAAVIADRIVGDFW